MAVEKSWILENVHSPRRTFTSSRRPVRPIYLIQLIDSESRKAFSAEFADCLERSQLPNCISAVPLFSGQDLITELGIRQGPVVGQVVKELLVYQAKNPTATRSDALQHLQAIISS